MEEILYSFKVNKHNSLVVTKWGGHKAPLETYTITARGRGKCDCMGSMRKPYCKHREMVDRLYKLKIPLMGAFYDNDRDIFYTPEDGEGIPLRGAVDIWANAIAQGKEY